MKIGIAGGIVAGLIFVLVEMILVPTVGGGSAFGPPRMMAAIAMGKDVLPPPATFDAGIFAVGMLVHFALSAVLGVIFALLSTGFRWHLPPRSVLGWYSAYWSISSIFTA